MNNKIKIIIFAAFSILLAVGLTIYYLKSNSMPQTGGKDMKSYDELTQQRLRLEKKFRDDIDYSIDILEDQTQSKEMRYGAEDALCEIETQNIKAFNSLLTVFSNKEEKEPNVRYAIAICFRDNKELRAVGALIHALNDDDSMMRYKAAQVLGELKVQKAATPLENMLKNDSDEINRERASRSLKMIMEN